MDDVLKYLGLVNIYFHLNGMFSDSVTRQFCYWFIANNIPFLIQLAYLKALRVVFSAAVCLDC